MMGSGSGKGDFPVNSCQFVVEINGIHTDFVINKFSNHIFVIVTQNGKIGSMVRATREENVSGRPIGKDEGEEPLFDVISLLGKRREKEPIILARQMIQRFTDPKKALILGFMLVDKTKKTIDEILAAVSPHL